MNLETAIDDVRQALSNHSSKVTPLDVLELIASLEVLTACFYLPCLWKCPRCDAKIGWRCQTPDDRVLRWPGHERGTHILWVDSHAPRTDRAGRAHCLTSPRAWRQDLMWAIENGCTDLADHWSEVRNSVLCRRVRKVLDIRAAKLHEVAS